MIVKGQTKSGIQFQLDDNIKDDARFIFIMSRLQTDEMRENPHEALKVLRSLFNLIFGTDEATMTFMDAVATAHGGICSVKNLISEINEMFEAINAKNSSSSPE